MFSVVDAVLLRPLPYPEPDLLAWVALSNPSIRMEFMLGPDYLEWSEQSKVFENMTAFDSTSCDLAGGDEPVRLVCGTVTQSFFAVMGIQPVLGRGFVPEEDQKQGPKAVILTDGLWRSHFGGDAGVLGRTVTLDGETYNVIGVMPSGFLFPGQTRVDVLTAQRLDVAEQLSRKSMRLLKSIGRMRPGVAIAQARAELNVLLEDNRRHFPRIYKDAQARVLPLAEHESGRVRLSLLTLLAAAACVLLIACVNVANLLLARAVSRSREIAIRMALGADRTRLALQLLSESALLGLLGGAAGLLVAGVGLNLVLNLAPEGIPRLAQAGLDGRVLTFTVAVSLVTGLLFGFAPVLVAGRGHISTTLKEAGSPATPVSGSGLRRGLVVAELALSLVLLTGAILLIQSLWRLQNVPLGFQPARLLTSTVMLKRYPDLRRTTFIKELHERVASIPGVQAVAFTTALPPEGRSAELPFTREGHPIVNSGDGAGKVIARAVSPEYFRAMATPLLRGRFFDNRDTLDAIGACLVNDALVRRYFANEDPIGRRIMGGPRKGWLTIVGVVADAKNSGLRLQPQPELYWALQQLHPRYIPSVILLVRTRIGPENMVPLLRAELRHLSPDLPITFRTMEQELGALTLRLRFIAVLLGIFSGIALLLAAVGIYGMFSYSITQRKREIGIRMALGASQVDVTRMVARDALRLVGTGIAIGLPLVLGLTRYLKSLLFEVQPTDPLILTAVCMLLSLVALMASWIPARRAACVNPLVALHSE